VAAMTTVEHWFLIFRLLSCVSANDRGRFYVWEILCFLIKDNLISNLNFTPCRDLVIQFLHRSFTHLFAFFPHPLTEKTQSDADLSTGTPSSVEVSTS
jgi:hypothetical protein